MLSRQIALYALIHNRFTDTTEIITKMCHLTNRDLSFEHPVKPWIDKSQIQIIKLKVGQPFDISLRYRAEPDPEVKWFAGETVS